MSLLIACELTQNKVGHPSSITVRSKTRPEDHQSSRMSNVSKADTEYNDGDHGQCWSIPSFPLPAKTSRLLVLRRGWRCDSTGLHAALKRVEAARRPTFYLSIIGRVTLVSPFDLAAISLVDGGDPRGISDWTKCDWKVIGRGGSVSARISFQLHFL